MASNEYDDYITSSVKVSASISSDGLEAYITIRGGQKKEIPRKLIESVLEEEGIVFGIDNKAIEELCASTGRRGQPTTVANGKKPELGQSAQIKYLFETNPQPQVDTTPDGKIDYRETGVIQQVEVDQLLAVKTPAVSGENGTSVNGRILKGKTGRDTELQRGAGTEFKDHERLELFSSISGCVTLHKDRVVEVSGEYIVDSDVSFKSGNIRFDGTVIIRGDVRSGFKVISTGDIEVKGIVEDATIHCGGNLLVRGGFVGTGKGICMVKGETHIRFVENQTIIGNGDVHVAEEIIHSRVTTRGNVFVKYGKGAIIGGETSACKGVFAKTIGNVHYISTIINVGKDDKILDVADTIDDVLADKDSLKENIQQGINKFVELKYKYEGFSQEQEDSLNYLYDIMGKYDDWMKILDGKSEEFNYHKEDLEEDSFVIANRKAFPGVVINIGQLTMRLDKEEERSIYQIKDGSIKGGRPSGYEEQQLEKRIKDREGKRDKSKKKPEIW
jgi:uncharacterized protein